MVNSYENMMGSPEDLTNHRFTSSENKKMPNFNAPMTGRNAPENNWEDQRATDNRVNNAVDIDEAGSWRK